MTAGLRSPRPPRPTMGLLATGAALAVGAAWGGPATAAPAASAAASAERPAASTDPEPAESSSAPAASPPAVAAPSAIAPVALPSASTGHEAPAPVAGEVVELRGRRVFTFRVERDGVPPRLRAREATQLLERAAQGARGEDVTVARHGTVATVLVRDVPTVRLFAEDARAAGAGSVDELAAAVADELRAALDEEGRRAAVIRTVFSVSLVVASGLLALVLVRLARALAVRVRRWLDANESRVPAFTIRSIEVVNARVVRGVLEVGLAAARWVAQLSVAYLWLVFSLSRFDSTRPYTTRLAGYVLSPLSSLLDRLVSTVPPAIVGLVAAAVLLVLLRFLSLYFAAVQRGETSLAGVSPELAQPASQLVRIVVVIAAIVFLGPIVTGDAGGPLALLGTVAVATLGLASVPLVATALVGALQLFGGRLARGQWVAVGGSVGRVAEVTLLDVRLVDEAGRESRIPHLLGLFRPIRLLRSSPRRAVRVSIPTAAATPTRLQQMATAVAAIGEEPRVEVRSVGPAGAVVRVSVATTRGDARSALLLAVAPLVGETVVPRPGGPGLGGR